MYGTTLKQMKEICEIVFNFVKQRQIEMIRLLGEMITKWNTLTYGHKTSH